MVLAVARRHGRVQAPRPLHVTAPPLVADRDNASRVVAAKGYRLLAGAGWRLAWVRCSVVSTLNAMSHDYGGPRPPTFSQAHGYVEYPTDIQVKSLDERLRIDLWNYVSGNYLNPQIANPIPLHRIWTDYLGRLIDDYYPPGLFDEIRRAVIAGPWYGVYDLIQWLTQNTLPGYPSPSDDFNRILASNRADHRIVERHVVAITNETELAAITSAIGTASTPAGNHIKNALALFANRDSPNFGKSIQESISAAESAAQELAGVTKPLGEALAVVRKQGHSDLHPALINGWKNLYGFTSDSGGIRHAADPTTTPPSQALAQYFLVTCSAFVNLVTTLKTGTP